MRKYIIKKLFKGNIASVRSFIVDACVKKKVGLRIIYQNQCMELSYDDLLNKRFQIVKKAFTSKFGTEPYYLIDFRWNPKVQKDD